MSESFRCAACDSPTTVRDSRGRAKRGVGQMIRRRRMCNKCKLKVTTYESTFDAVHFDKILSSIERRLHINIEESNRLLLDLAEIRDKFQEEAFRDQS